MDGGERVEGEEGRVETRKGLRRSENEHRRRTSEWRNNCSFIKTKIETEQNSMQAYHCCLPRDLHYGLGCDFECASVLSVPCERVDQCGDVVGTRALKGLVATGRLQQS